MSLLPLKLREACFLETSWSGVTTTFSGLLPMVMVGKSSKSMLALVLMRDEAGVLTKTRKSCDPAGAGLGWDVCWKLDWELEGELGGDGAAVWLSLGSGWSDG